MMKRETIEKMLNFLKEKEGHEIPESWFFSVEKLKLIEKLENHPDDIQYKYEGDLHLSNTNITKLPNDLYVKGGLFLFNSKQITKLPDKLHVGAGLSLFNCKQITKLPDKLYVGGWFDIRGCNQLTEIPNNLFVARDFFIANTPLSKKYSHEEIREMITSKGGTIIGNIKR